MIAFLCTAIIVTLGYFILTGGTRKLSNAVKTTNTTPIVITSTPTPTPSITPQATFTPSVTDLPLVNKLHPLDENYVPGELVSVNVNRLKDERLKSEAAEALEEMFAAASNEGINLQLLSGYRSYSEETQLYAYYSNLYGQGYADMIDDQPGYSEHQLGLAVDLDVDGESKCTLNACFAFTTEGKWLADNSYKYGWIVRYPLGKEDVTGMMYSPWSFRYVGKTAAEEMYVNNLTLEEYLGQN